MRAPERVERALDALAERHCEGRSGVVLERVAGGYGFRAATGTAEACARLFERAPDRALSHAALETLAVIAYAGPVSRPRSPASAACRPTPRSPACWSAA